LEVLLWHAAFIFYIKYWCFRVYDCGMYTKVTNSGGRRYLQIVEGYRTDEGKVRHRVVANLGRIDQLTPEKLDPLINGLNRALGRAENTSSEIIHEPGRSYGDVFALLCCVLAVVAAALAGSRTVTLLRRQSK